MASQKRLQQNPLSYKIQPLTQTQVNKKTKKLIKDINSALSLENYPLADDHIKALITLNPDPTFTIKRAHLMFIRKEYQKAEHLYKKVLKSTKEVHNQEIYFGLGQVYYESKMFYDAYLAYNILVSNYPNFKYTDFVYLRLLKIMVFYQNFDEAYNYIKIIMKKGSVGTSIFAEVLVCLALIKYKRRKLDLAIKICGKSRNLNEGFNCNLLLLILLAEKDPREAEKICSSVLNSTQDTKEWKLLCFIRAVIYIRLKKYNKAIQILEENCNNIELEAEYLNYLGIAYHGAGDKIKALEVFQELRTKFSENYENLNNLAYVYNELGMKFEAFYVCNVMEGLNNGKREDLKKLEIQQMYLNPYRIIEVI